MNILAIDPGTEQSAIVRFDGRTIVHHEISRNEDIALTLEGLASFAQGMRRRLEIVCEAVESFGMPVGREVFQTVRWTGFFERSIRPTPMHWMPRRTVKMHLCNSAKAKDANIRQALLDKFGGKSAIGKKKSPGPLYGLKGHEFAALAVAVTFYETRVVRGVVHAETMDPTPATTEF